jgi:hypothetical protein
MRHDRRPKHQAITIDTPVGLFCEMDVWLTQAEIVALTAGQLRPSPRLLFEPWIRLSLSVAHEADGRQRLVPENIDAGIDVVDQDDGA